MAQSSLLYSHSVRRLNFLADQLHAEKYLEIGVETGVTFHQINCPKKVAVDPFFRFDASSAGELNQHGSCDYHQISSDEFFQKLDRNAESFDLVFIDGLHHYDQVMRDFAGSILFSHSKTVFLVDDVLPCDAFSALREQRQALELRHQYSNGYKGNAWHGDGYLFVLMLPVYFPLYRFQTLMEPGANPQTVIWYDPQCCDVDEWQKSRSLWASQNLAACGYTWLLDNIDMLNPVREVDGLQSLLERLSNASR